ncbi:hypothetical protein FIBSPDRAFT_77776, partial [Athelia psychrophila]
MSSTGTIVGSICGGLAVLAVVVAIAFFHFRRSGGARLVGRIKGLSLLHSGVDIESNRSNSPPRQISKLEVFAKAVRALEQAKQVIAGRCVHILASPVDGLLDVVQACGTNEQEEGALDGILQALAALDGRLDSALVLLHERVAPIESNPQQPPDTEQCRGDWITMGSLLETLSGTKHILAQAHSSIETPCPDIVDSIRSAVQDFAALNELCIEDIVVANAASGELEDDGALGQRTSLPPRSTFLSNFTDTLRTVFQQLGQMALKLRLGCPGRSTFLHFRADVLFARFERFGEMADLEQAIVYHRAALELRPPGHPNHSTSLIDLANALQARFQQLGRMADLEQAIIYQRDALELCPPGHPNCA